VSELLKTKNLTCKRSEKIIINNLNFAIPQGKNVEVIGSNGSGKTTLLRALLGLVPETEGEILWHGKNIKQVENNFYKSCFYQGHKLGIKKSLTVLENLKHPNFPLISKKEKLYSAAKKVGISDLMHRVSSNLSVGQIKRIALARLLICDFDLYLIDEPFTALDNEGTDLIQSIIAELNNRGSSFLVTGHRESELISDKIYLGDTDE
tara:strand:+ start:22219 stop:22839 length:621 start_codon:yes stop_codon:yes gene_type:complete